MQKTISKAIVLAAGVGKRLLPQSPDLPKTLVNVGEKTIFERIITPLKSYDIKEIIVVTGFCHEKLDQIISEKLRNEFSNLSFKLVFNPDFEKKNNIYSFWVAGKEMAEDFLLINSDVLFHPKILDFCLQDQRKSFLIVDDSKPLGKEDMKVKMTKEGVIEKVSKDLPPKMADGEYIGVAKISKETAKLVLFKADKILKQGRYDVFYEEAFDQLAQEGAYFWGASTRGLPWIEIDTVADLKRAREKILPRIEVESQCI